jgi:hypothetical protein
MTETYHDLSTGVSLTFSMLSQYSSGVPRRRRHPGTRR